MLRFHLLAVNGSDIIYTGLGAAQDVQQSFDKLWTQILGGPAYQLVSKTAGTLAAIFVIVWLVRHQKDLDGNADHLKHIFYTHLSGPIFVFILLAGQIGGYSVLASTTLSIRNFNNSFSDAVLAQIAYQVTDPVTKGLAKTQAEQLVSSGLQECYKIVNQSERENCFTQLQDKLNNTIAPYRDEQWAQDLKDKLDKQVIAVTQDEFGLFLDDAVKAIGGFSDQVITDAILVICGAISSAVSWLIEIIGIMAAFVGPLVIAICLFPKFEDAWKPWITGVVGIGLISLLYKFSIGLVSIQVLNATNPTQLIGPVCLALLGIVLVGGFLTGGGVAAFQIGQSTLSSYGDSARRIGTGVVGGATRGVGRFVRR